MQQSVNLLYSIDALFVNAYDHSNLYVWYYLAVAMYIFCDISSYDSVS